MAITLKAARVNKGFTQKEAAKRLGISEEALRSYELGRSYPSIALIPLFEREYDVKYDDIIFFTK